LQLSTIQSGYQGTSSCIYIPKGNGSWVQPDGEISLDRHDCATRCLCSFYILSFKGKFVTHP